MEKGTDQLQYEAVSGKLKHCISGKAKDSTAGGCSHE